MGNKDLLTENAQFVRCGTCDHIHLVSFEGDCRDNSNRFTDDELETVYGSSYHDRVTDTIDFEDTGEEE